MTTLSPVRFAWDTAPLKLARVNSNGAGRPDVGPLLLTSEG
jgi:hypothetical protein